MRTVTLTALLALASCATTPDTAQTVYALGAAYQASTIAETACIASATCSASSAKALDTAAYNAVLPLVQTAAAGGTIDAVALTAAQEAVAAFSAYVASKGSK